MRMRWIIALGALLFVGAVVVTGIGAAQLRGAGSPQQRIQQMIHQQEQSGPGGMMGSGPGSSGMMGPGSYGMMGGHHGDQSQQNPSSATPVPVTGDTVAIENFAFQPANLRIKAGTTVTWTNKDAAPHTVTFQDSSLTSSGVLRQGDTYRYTFTTAGTFAYYCDLHRYMTAQVTVTQ